MHSIDYTQEHKISIYIEKQLADLEKQHKERTEKKNQALQDIKNIQKEIDKEWKAFQDEGEGDKYRNIFLDFLKKNGYNTNLFKSAFENSKEGKSEEFIEKVTKVFEIFLSSAHVREKRFDELNKKMYFAKEAKNKATHTLSHKSNRRNLEKQIDDIKTGRTRTGIENEIKKDILKIFKKIDHLSVIVDDRSLQEIFTSIMATQLITDCKTNKQIKKSLIRNHTDKLGLFDHIRRIYNDNTRFFLQIETGREELNESGYFGDILKNKVEQIVEESKEILEKIPAIGGYFRLGSDATQEDVKTRKNKEYKERKDIVINDLASHLREVLNTPEKEGARCEQKEDKKLKKLLEGIYMVTDSLEFERYCEKLRNIDANRYREILGTEGRILLREIYQAMNEEERSIICSDYKHYRIFEDMAEHVHKQERIEKEKQLKLFDFAPIYNSNGYLEQTSTHIESLIGRLSLDHKRKFEGIVRDMLADQGHNGYIDTGKEIHPLSEEEFIERVKNSKGGKALSLKLKKVEGNLLPDINERIEETKKTVKGDIV